MPSVLLHRLTHQSAIHLGVGLPGSAPPTHTHTLCYRTALSPLRHVGPVAGRVLGHHCHSSHSVLPTNFTTLFITHTLDPTTLYTPKHTYTLYTREVGPVIFCSLVGGTRPSAAVAVFFWVLAYWRKWSSLDAGRGSLNSPAGP